MPLMSIGDLANSFVLRRRNVQLNQDLSRLTLELSSGIAADLPRHLGGSFSTLGDIERGLRVNRGHAAAVTEAAGFTGAMQSALGRVQTASATLADELLLATQTSLPEALQTASTQARGQFSALVSTLNTTMAGRALFSGAATDMPSLADATTILSALETAVAGEVTLGGILAAVEDWFDLPGGGFETLAYQGSDSSLSPFRIGEGEAVDLDLRADHGVIRDLLRHAAIAALAADPGLGYPPDLQAQLLTASGEALLTIQPALTGIRADLGYAEARIEDSQVRLASERTALQIARNDLIGVDPYETATRLEAVQFQLESLYTATARLSGLSLVEYL